MKKGTHGQNEETFEDLSYSNQAKSINGQIRVLEKALLAHFRKGGTESKDVLTAKSKFTRQITNLISKI